MGFPTEAKGAGGAWSGGEDWAGADRVTKDAGLTEDPQAGFCRARSWTSLAKGRSGVGLGSETWAVIELRREQGAVEKGSFILSASGAASLHHVWTPVPQGVAQVG